jgi:tetratricopeptide (TPR) repeat protein
MKAIKERRAGRARNRGPDPIPVLAYLAARYLRYGPMDQARALYGLLISLKPRQRDYRIALGYACLKAGRAEESLAHLEAVFKGRSGLSGWETLLWARALRANGMMEESRDLIERNLKGYGTP